MTVEQIMAEAERLAMKLERISFALDANISAVDSAADRGKLSRVPRSSLP